VDRRRADAEMALELADYDPARTFTEVEAKIAISEAQHAMTWFHIIQYRAAASIPSDAGIQATIAKHR